MLGAEHKDTLESKFSLACALYKQPRYNETEQLYQELVQQQGKAVGAKHIDTLDSQYWLAKAKSSQKVV